MDTGGAPGTTLAQGSFKVTKQYLRYAAHAASDAVFEKLTGIKGAFRTRIAYVVQKTAASTLTNCACPTTMVTTSSWFTVPPSR